MELTEYFYDTYALYEIIRGSAAYDRYVQGVAATTSRLNLMEIYYSMLRQYNLDLAERSYAAFLPNAVDLDDETIRQAMRFKHANKNLNLSYVDCIGYIMARQRNINFLTGDSQFKNLLGVEYVK